MKTFTRKPALLLFLIITFSTNLFAQTSGDQRPKVRLGFTCPDNTHRQLLVTADENATSGIDFGYDAELNTEEPSDMYWIIENVNFLIQGIDSIDENTTLPLGLNTESNGLCTIQIDGLDNIPDTLDIVLLDKENNTYHNIKNNSGYSFNIVSGTYLDRFELLFSEDNSLSTNNFETLEKDIQFYFANNSKTVVINNPKLKEIKKVEMFNMLGQSVIAYNNIKNQDKIKLNTNNITSGTYIIEIKTNDGKLSKKVLIK
ncbi:T9SS type A sorting domain-containing protein [Lacinutrix algicola]|uniref:T9SS type A sorting domain-containing protein n=1 Tax=Lacinutrix algicola TaxID=342954 RepID=UPI0006E41613|nr:T9SS type A sorting domain-containing protein [Lacinutrix algicola]